MDAEKHCRRAAAAQDNLIHRDQAVIHGVSVGTIERRLSCGSWTAVLPRVYVLDGAEMTWTRKVRAASLWAGDRSALSHETAAALWGFEGFTPEAIVLTTERALRSRQGIHVHRVSALRPAEITDLAGKTVTSPAKTLLDLAGTVGLVQVEAALDDALRSRRVSLPKLRWFLDTHTGRGRRGAAVLRRLLSARPPGYVPPESALERRVWDLLISAGLPPPVRQYEIFDGSRFVARVDLAYPDARVAIEADGYRWHSGRRAWSDDLGRRNRLTALGWRTLHVTHDDLTRPPEELRRQVTAVLSERTLC
jgi:very-short-patch-repair endonuclease